MVLWVFGYGSLVWKAGFDYDERVVGFIKGYRRVFHQASTDHRGTRESPGRTVTLERQEGEVTWGAAYCVSGKEEEQLVLSVSLMDHLEKQSLSEVNSPLLRHMLEGLEYLEMREFEYDERAFIDFYTEDSPCTRAISVLVYIGSPNKSKNQYYLGPAPLEDIASQIAKAAGPAGPNYEYLFRLEEALYEIGCVDEYIIKLAKEVRKHLGHDGLLNGLLL